MTSFLASLLLLAGPFAIATPVVGDVVNFNVTATQQGVAYAGTYSMQITAYDPASQNYNVHATVVLNGATQVKDQATAASQLLNDATIQQVLASCPQYGGTAQVLTTPAGVFNSCALPTSNAQQGMTGTTWVAAVPFGIIKSVSNYTNGNTQTFTIASFSAGVQ